MLFNSLDFAVFLPIVFALYWYVLKNRLKAQNLLIAVSSYVFYGWWDWRFLSLILFSTIVDYLVGLAIDSNTNKSARRGLLLISLFVNLGLLGVFKYYNFFVDNFIAAFSFFGQDIKPNTLNVILPVGISFYTFQTLSYAIDVYRDKLKPTKDFISFAAFVSFFPQLVAGPIERASNLLPQFYKNRVFRYSQAVDGLRQILWGLFKKVVIADNCAEFANHIFNNSDQLPGGVLALGALFFAFQIYGDFSGYSDIAIGTARLFGFNLMQNFAFPYFSRDIAEFWRRWHISLSTWFRDYLYIPLGGSRVSKSKAIRNTFIIFIVSGFWHGSNWTFVIWGALNAIYFLPLLLSKKNRSNIDSVAQGRLLPNLKELASILLTFSMTLIAWVFFRADSASHAFSFLKRMIVSIQVHFDPSPYYFLFVLLLIFILIEWRGRDSQFALEKFALKKPAFLRRSAYVVIALSVFVLGGKQQDFIYFQF